MASTTQKATAAKLIDIYRADWVKWARDVLGVTLTPDQLTVIDDVQQAVNEGYYKDKVYRRILVASGFGVGKTFLAALAELAFSSMYRSENLVTSSSLFQVKHRLWAEFRRLYAIAKRRGRPIGGKLNKLSLEYKTEKHVVMATATKDGSNIQGGHTDRQSIVFDEGQAVEHGIWNAGEAMMGSRGAWWLVLLNPIVMSGDAYENSRKPHLWRVRNLSCLNHPNVIEGKNIVPGAVSREWVEERRIGWGEGSPLWQARVEGKWPETPTDTLVAMGDLVRMKDQVLHDEQDEWWLGVDVARFGDDQNYVAVVYRNRVVYMESWSGLDTMQTCGKVHQLCKEYGIPWDHVNIDGNGIGAGVVDRLREQGLEVNDIQFGGAAVGDWADLGDYEYFNRRSELYWNVRLLLQQGRASIPEKFSMAWSDLMAPRYEFTSKGQIKLESKKDIKKRIGRSPDAGDAIVLGFARELNAAPTVILA